MIYIDSRLDINLTARMPVPISTTTLKDVALDAGVSVATASFALRGHTSISEETRNRVIESKERLGYRRARLRKPHLANRRVGATQNLGLLYCIIDYPLEQASYSRFLQGVMKACRENNIRLELASDTSEHSFPINLAKESNIQGVILTGMVTRPVIDYFSERGLKVIVLGNYDISDVHTVEVDIVHAGKSLARRIIEDGHESIAYLVAHPDNYFESEFLMGIRKELEAGGLELPPSRIMRVPVAAPYLAEAAQALIAMRPRVTAIMSEASELAELCLGEVRARVPAQNEVPMFYSLAKDKRPSITHLTLLDLSLERCGYLAVLNLSQLITRKNDVVCAFVLRAEKWLTSS